MNDNGVSGVIDVCAIPPLPETLEGFANPNGPFAKYNQLYSDSEKEAIMGAMKGDPAGFLLALMDEAGVERVLLTAEDAETTFNMVTPNESVYEFVMQKPDRFMFMGAVDPHKGMKAVRQIEHLTKNMNMKCLCLEPWLHKLRSNDKLYYPIYAKCVEMDMPIWIHTSLNFVPQLSMDFGRPIHLDEVAGHFPELKIIAGHGGWPWVPEMMAVIWRHENVYADFAAINPRYLGAEGSGWDTLLRYGNTLLREKILFATAWPAQDFKTGINEVMALPLKDEVKKLWLSENARRLLKI